MTDKNTENKTEVAKAGQQGSTSIADIAVAKIAGLAIQDIEGVYNVGSSAARALGAMREAVGAEKSVAQGINVEVGETEAAIDLALIVEYPHPLREVADKVRAAIYEGVQDIAGLVVKEVNISITDVHIPSADEEEETAEESSVQAALPGGGVVASKSGKGRVK